MAKSARGSDFYRLRLKTGLNEAKSAELCGVTQRSFRNWDIRGQPAMAERLLSLWNRKYVALPGWEGFCFSRSRLVLNGKELFHRIESIKVV